ncbi:hypothetical protein BDW62DRAFT_197261 [Aspergillus aurantiobrunneus]
MSFAPERCNNVWETVELPYDNWCAIPLYQNRNATQDPLETLRGCCPSADVNIGFAGTNNCSVYCNSTEQMFEGLETCLLQSWSLAEFGCSSDAARGYRGFAGGWGICVIVGLVLASVSGV